MTTKRPVLYALCGIGAIIAIAIGFSPLTRTGSSETISNRVCVEKFLDLINRHHRVREAFEQYVSQNYIQHNPSAGNGREDAINLIERLSATPGFSPSIARIVAEGDLVAVHMHVRFRDDPGLAVMDMFRLKDGKIVEHWDVIQKIPEKTRSGNSMF